MTPRIRSLSLIQPPLHVSPLLRQSQCTGSFQHSDSASHTRDISVLADGPFAATLTLSRNCDNETVLPAGVSHTGNGSDFWSVPNRLMTSTPPPPPPTRPHPHPPTHPPTHARTHAHTHAHTHTHTHTLRRQTEHRKDWSGCTRSRQVQSRTKTVACPPALGAFLCEEKQGQQLHGSLGQARGHACTAIRA